MDDERSGVGQVVGRYGDDALYLAIFERLLAVGDAVSGALGVLSDGPVFLALSTDAKIHVGHWSVVSNAAVGDSIPFPVYKEMVGVPGNYEVVDYTGMRRRSATPAEIEILPNRKIVAPIRLQKALRAIHGLEPWNEVFEELRPGVRPTSADMFGDSWSIRGG
ncbi:hypothetical protein [Isoptericola sp. NPDC055881]